MGVTINTNYLLLSDAMPFFNSTPVVVVLRFSGVIGQAELTSRKSITLIDKAFSTPHVICVCLVVNSPGGSAADTSLIADYIKHKSEICPAVKVISFVEGCAASGGYFIACAGQQIFTNKFAIVGSIGAVLVSADITGLLDKMGVKPVIFSAGERKLGLNPLVEHNEEHDKIYQDIVDDIHAEFIKFVEQSRGDRIKMADKDLLFSGAVWSGKRAVGLGLVDDTYDVMEKKVTEVLGLDNFRVVEIKNKRKGLLSYL